MSEEKIIEIKYRREHLENIYLLAEKDTSSLFRRLLKPPFTHILLLIACLFSIPSVWKKEEHFGGLFIFGILIFYAANRVIQYFSAKIKRRREISQYLDKLDKIKEHKLILSANSFTLVQDQVITLEKWAEIKKAEIHDSYMYIISNSQTYTLPRASMTVEEFDLLCDIISEKMKNQ